MNNEIHDTQCFIEVDMSDFTPEQVQALQHVKDTCDLEERTQAEVNRLVFIRYLVTTGKLNEG